MNYTRLLLTLLLICLLIEMLHIEPVSADLEILAFKLLKKAWKKKFKKKKIIALPIPIILKKNEGGGKHE